MTPRVAFRSRWLERCALPADAEATARTVWTNSDALVGSLSLESQMGARMGAAQSFKERGDMAGPLLIGLRTRFFGVRVGFVTCGALALITLVALRQAGALGQPCGAKERA